MIAPASAVSQAGKSVASDPHGLDSQHRRDRTGVIDVTPGENRDAGLVRKAPTCISSCTEHRAEKEHLADDVGDRHHRRIRKGGTVNATRWDSTDGIESTFTVNHLAHCSSCASVHRVDLVRCR